MSATYDVVVLGAGSGGYACALRAAQLGLSVALVERDVLGGTCLHRGCIPTKAYLHAAEVADAVRESAVFGIQATLQGVDLGAVRRYADGVVAKLHKGLTGLISSRGITVVRGTGRLIRDDPAGERTDDGGGAHHEAGSAGSDSGLSVQVSGDSSEVTTLQAGAVVLATGSASRSLPGVEVDGERVLTSEHALRLEKLPRSAVILGGGVIGVEFASAWRSFGVDVTVLEALPRLVPGEEPEVSAALLRAFRRRGIAVRTGTRVETVATSPDAVTVTLADQATLTADLLLVAVGRRPVSEEIGLSEAGVQTERGFVVTDERLATSVPGVWAVGDLVQGLQLAHRGFAHGIFVAEEIAHARGLPSGDPAAAPQPVRDRDVPRVTYCDPEIASVGLGEEAARSAYDEVETVIYDLAGNGRSQILRTAGFVKLVRQVDGPVIGVHVIGARAGELIAEAQLITAWEALPHEVAASLHAHPTQSEAIGEAHLALAGKPLHAHR